MRKLQIAAGTAFVGAWVVGIALEADGPKPDDTAATIAGYFSAHEHKAMLAHLLIDGVAGAAIIGLAVSLHRFLRGADERLARVVLGAGIAAGLTSLAQLALGEVLTYRAGHGGDADNVKTLFTALNNCDTVKIALLGLMIGAASLAARRSGALPRWLATGGLVFAPLLALSGLAFPLSSDALYASLELTLALLLSWVVAVTVAVARSTREAEPAPALAS